MIYRVFYITVSLLSTKNETCTGRICTGSNQYVGSGRYCSTSVLLLEEYCLLRLHRFLRPSRYNFVISVGSELSAGFTYRYRRDGEAGKSAWYRTYFSSSH